MTHEKYTNEVQFALARLRRAALMSVIRPLVRWEPMLDPIDGYTIVIAAGHRLLPILAANLRFLARQDLEHAREILVMIDAPAGKIGEPEQARLRTLVPSVPLRFVHYTPMQTAVAHHIDWGWVYCWISWCTGLRESTTRWVLLHDLDALLLAPDTLAKRYAAACRGTARFIGVRPYVGGGVTPEDGLVTTFELMLDAAFVREHFRPIRLFNRPLRLNGRRLDLDTFLLVQHVARQSEVLPIDEHEMVHPSQMICQFVDHVVGRRVGVGTNNLLMLPYYFYLGGDPAPLRRIAACLRAGHTSVPLFGKSVDPGQLLPTHKTWLFKQAARAETCLWGQVRSEIREYFDLIAGAKVHPLSSSLQLAQDVLGEQIR